MGFKVTEDYYFFYGQDSVFSNWYKCEIKEYGIKFNCVEQYMMFNKALLFNDKIIMKRILNTDNPYRQKKLGRKVKGFDDDVWNRNKRRIVRRAVELKFRQNHILHKTLMKTRNRLMVEANQYDSIWGIGMSMEDENILDQSQWKGMNLLGRIITDVRNSFK